MRGNSVGLMKPPASLLAPALLPALVLGSVLAFGAPAAAETGTESLDVESARTLIESRIAEILDEEEIPGAAAALVVDGETVLAEGYGEAVAADGTPFAADTAYYTGSVGKLFTTAAALQLVAEGGLDLDADVNDHLAFTVPDTYPGRPITLRHLLTHTSGFEDRIAGWGRWDAGDMPDLAEFAAAALPDRLRPPGEVVTYDNYDMVLAGLLIEDASGQSYEDYVAEHVFAPLGMDHSRIVHEEPAKDAATAEGHRYADGQVPTEGRLSPGVPAGPGILTTADDMARFMTALATGDPALGEGVAEQMTTRQFGADDRMPGMGFSLQEFAGPGGGVWFKDGDVSGFHSALALVPARGIGVHIALNGDGTDAAATIYAARTLVGDVLTALDALPAPAEAPAASDDLDAYTGEYVSTRTSRSDFTEVTRLFGPVTVTAADGLLHTTGLSFDPEAGEQHWTPLGDGLFRERDGDATIAFTADGLLLSSQDPAVAYAPVPWHESSTLHLAALAFGTLVLTAGLLVLTATAFVRLFRRGDRKPLLRTATAWTAWLLGGTALAVLALLMTAMSDQNLLAQRVVTGSPLLTTALALGLATVALTAVTAAVFATACAKRQLTKHTATGHALMLAGGLAFSAVLLSVNLTVL